MKLITLLKKIKNEDNIKDIETKKLNLIIYIKVLDVAFYQIK